MEKTILIDGKEIPFKATGNTPRLYRAMFHRDIFRDIDQLSKSIEIANEKKKEENTEASYLDTFSLEIFENMAYVMAKQADPTIPKSIDEWLDGFNVFSVYTILPEIIELWNLNTMQISASKKNIAALTAK